MMIITLSLGRKCPAFTLPTALPISSWNCKAVQGRRPCSQHVLRRLGTAVQQNATYLTKARRRPRGNLPTQAIFIWSNEFGDEGEDVDNGQTEDASTDGHLSDDIGSPDERDEVDSVHDDASRAYYNDSRGRSDPPVARNSSSFDAETGAHADIWGSTSPPSDDDDDDDDATNGVFSVGPAVSTNNPVYALLRTQTSGLEDMDRMRRVASDCAKHAFGKVVSGILGTLPGDVYDVVVTCERAAVARLMHSGLCTGYAMRNAEIRMMLNESINGRHAPDESAAEASHINRHGHVDATGTRGSVRWWDNDTESPREMSTRDYIARLEAENELLRERVCATARHAADDNKLVAFMKTLNPDKIAALQKGMTDDAVDAMSRTIRKTLGDFSGDQVQATYSVRRDYLGQLVLWCLHVGYTVRNIEKRMEMTRVFQETEAFTGPWV